MYWSPKRLAALVARPQITVFSLRGFVELQDLN